MATPLAAGVAALTWSSQPGLTPGQVFNRLQQFQADALRSVQTTPLTPRFQFSGIEITDTCQGPCTADDRASVGETVVVTLKILNQGDPAYAVTGWLAGHQVLFGDIGANQIASCDVTYQVLPGGLLGNLQVTHMDPAEIRLPVVEYLPSNINSNTSLVQDRIYILNGQLTVASGACLTMNAGTRLEIATPDPIVVLGELNAPGTVGNPIHIEVGVGIDWEGFDFTPSNVPSFDTLGMYAGGNRLQHCVVSSGSDDITRPLGIAVSGTPYLKNNVFRGFETAVDCFGNGATGIEGNLFEFNGMAIAGFVLGETLVGEKTFEITD